MDNFDMNDSASNQAKIAYLTTRIETMENSVHVLQDAVISLMRIVERIQESENA